MPDIPQHRAAQFYRAHRVEQIVPHQNRVRALNRNVRTGAYRHAQIRLRQSRRVIYPVANHRNFPAAALKFLNLARLIFRQYFRHEIFYPDAFSYGARGIFIVARQHHNFDAQILKFADGSGGSLLLNVGGGDNSEQNFFAGKNYRRLTGGAKLGNFFANAVELKSQLRHKLFVTGKIFPAANFRRHALTENRAEIFYIARCQIFRSGGVHNRTSQRVFALSFQTGGNFQKFVHVHAECHNVRHERFARRQRAGFVDNHRINFVRSFQRFAGFYQNAILRAFAGADHNRNWRRQAERARTADNQN